jgi:hypothetical protein
VRKLRKTAEILKRKIDIVQSAFCGACLRYGLLSGLVLIRTFLSWTLLEIEGRWRWRREPMSVGVVTVSSTAPPDAV